MRFTLSIIFILFSLVVIAQPKPRWKFKTEGKVYGSPVINDNTLYVGSGDGNLYALDLPTGKEKWRFHTKGSINSSALCVDNVVVVNSYDGFIYAVDRSTGKEVWRFQTRGEKAYDMWDYYLSSPVADKNTIYIGSGDHFIYALNVKDGTLRWKFKTVGDKYFPKGEIQRGATIKDSVLYFGSRDYNIYAVNARTGKGHWNMKEYGSWVIATPTLHNGLVYFGTSDTHRFNALEEDYGQVKWSLNLNMRVYGSAVIDKDRIYFGCFNGKLYGVNATSGKIEWTFQTDGSTQNYHLVYNSEDHFKDGFQIYGGDIAASENTILSLGSILSTPVINAGVVYFGSADGNVYAVGL